MEFDWSGDFVYIVGSTVIMCNVYMYYLCSVKNMPPVYVGVLDFNYEVMNLTKEYYNNYTKDSL